MWNKVKKGGRENMLYILSFCIPAIILLIMCIANKVQPFGDRSLVIVDGLHQYMPFFSELWEKLKTGDSLFYSWNGGLGYNFMSLWTYYLASPLNLLLLLFSKNNLNMAVSFLIVLKISLTGLTGACYFVHRSNKKNFKILIFSTAFALSNFMVGYCWNVMWLDAIMIFPVILMGLEKMIEGKGWITYTLSLAYAMFCNYYIAFMICIFLVLWYVLYHHRSIKAFLGRGVQFGACSILSAAMAAIALLPAYFGLMTTASSDSMDLVSHEWFTNIVNILHTHMAAIAPIANDNFDGNANLYIGISTVLLAVLYVFQKEIHWFEKIKRILLLAFFIVSFNESVLNFIWHGFHDQYGIPNRFAFLYLFVLAITAFEALDKIEQTGKISILVSAVICIALLGGCYYYMRDQISWIAYGTTAFLIAIYSLMLFGWQNGNIKIKVLFVFAAGIEAMCMCFYGFSEVGQIDVSKFFADTKKIEAIKKDMEIGNRNRAELCAAKMLDEAIWHNLPCVTMFGSTANAKSVDMMDAIGFYTGANEYLYKGATPLTNYMLNVKYNILRKDDKNRNDMKCKAEYDDITLLESKYDSSIGFMVDESIADWNCDSAYPFRVLNNFMYTAFGFEDIFEDIPIDDPETSNTTAEKSNDGEYLIENTCQEAQNLVFTIFPDKKEDLYIHYDGSRVENTIIKIDQDIVVCDKINSQIFHVGMVEEGQEVTIAFELLDDGDNSGVVRLSAAAFHEEVLEDMDALLTDSKLNVSKLTSSLVEGDIYAMWDGVMFLSIPYDDGWTILVDGKEAEKQIIGDGFTGVKLSEGEHVISMKYVPEGFREGRLLSCMGWMIFLLFTAFDVMFWKKRMPKDH